MTAVATIDLPYIQAMTDRHGRPRYYFRRAGYARRALPGAPGSEEFMAAYGEALKPREGGAGQERAPAGSMSALIASYYRSAEFVSLRESTKVGYRSRLELFRAAHGQKAARLIEAHHINAILGGMAKRGAAANLRKRLRQVMQHAVDIGWRNDNPVLVTKKVKHKSDGFPPWTEDEIDRYKAHWASGTKQRLALELLLCCGQRVSDTAPMGRQHLHGGRISVVQLKTGKRLLIPVHRDLQAELDQLAASDCLTLVRTEYGKGFSVKGFGQWVVRQARAAGVEDRSAHGLRKAAGRRMAEAGCTAHEIMSVLGNTLAEAEKYCRDADQKKLAVKAIRKLSPRRARKANTDCQT